MVTPPNARVRESIRRGGKKISFLRGCRDMWCAFSISQKMDCIGSKSCTYFSSCGKRMITLTAIFR